MCQECGCGLGVAEPHGHEHTHAPVGAHPHARTGSGQDIHAHAPEVPGKPPSPLASDHPAHAPHVVQIQRSLVEHNLRHAEQNRGYFRAKQVLVLNMVSAPGSGKTTFIRKTAEALRGRLRVGVMTGDLATENDAQRLREAGIPVVQITTGTLCHLEADMVSRQLDRLDLDPLDLLIIENVGNLVCPASFDLGEHLRVVLLSVTEGEDKPLKYPPIFHSAHVAVLTKGDLAEAAGFDRAAALDNLRRISHHAEVLELSARTGEGMERWTDLLMARRKAQFA